MSSPCTSRLSYDILAIQPIPIPSYLIAIASGNVVYRPFPQYEDKKWKTGIWAEPQLIDAAYWEFSEDTARYVSNMYNTSIHSALLTWRPPDFWRKKRRSSHHTSLASMTFWFYLRRSHTEEWCVAHPHTPPILAPTESSTCIGERMLDVLDSE